uniref:Uncharacterized protein n=1 Tax=Tetranychus urticae TaxID=32264 RepID=T1KZY9_TETUR
MGNRFTDLYQRILEDYYNRLNNH